MSNKARTSFWILWGMAAAVVVSYGVRLVRAVRGLDKLKRGKSEDQPTVSVVIPARNEEASIRECLEGLNNQDYSTYLYEIIVVNDRSNDRTAEIVLEMRQLNRRIRLIDITEVPEGVAPKKHAITVGVESAVGRIIVTTDGDCRHPRGWLSGLVQHFEPDVGAVVGFALYDKSDRLFDNMQSLDFLSHCIMYGGAIGNRELISCSGANLAYRKEVFDQVGGFGDTCAHISGDDILLLDRIDRLTGWRIAASLSPDTYVATDPVRTVPEFLSQRVRWASKLTACNGGTKLVLVHLGLVSLLVLALLPLSIAMPRTFGKFLPLLGAKIAIDYWTIKKGSDRFDRPDLMKYFWITDLLNPYYNMVSGICGAIGRFRWKGERYRRKA
jgi:cellulose synthase/poly-beta-1,6-N-acetylglucosamine synthase-like glycosyltransferase